MSKPATHITPAEPWIGRPRASRRMKLPPIAWPVLFTPGVARMIPRLLSGSVPPLLALTIRLRLP